MSDPFPSPDLPACALELEDVDVPAPSNPDALVVRDLNWRVGVGEHWLLAGGTGSGKTSVLQVAAGLIRPSRGRQRLFGVDLADLRETEVEAHRSRVGMVFGGGGRLFNQLNVAENLALPLLYHGRDRREGGSDRIAEVLEGLTLGPLAQRLPRELPRRLLERVALARALVLEPEVLLLDDVAAGFPSADVDWWRGFVESCIAGSCGVAPTLRTLVLAATESGIWRDLVDRVATVEAGGWRTDPGREKEQEKEEGKGMEDGGRKAGRGIASGAG
jgi:ABC-type ATPase involved in cell division